MLNSFRKEVSAHVSDLAGDLASIPAEINAFRVWNPIEFYTYSGILLLLAGVGIDLGFFDGEISTSIAEKIS